MMHKLITIEKELILSFSMLLFLLNIVSIYFFLDLLNYDEITGYLENGLVKRSNPRQLAFFFFITALLNLFFISVYLLFIMLNQNKSHDRNKSK